ncbi:MAG: tetratricopeptide repeat protein [Spirochaetes bacterium]|nr:tetratricopeptide repeat protein [Spirochaetota bacterium]
MKGKIQKVSKYFIIFYAVFAVNWLDPYRDKVDEGNKKFYEKKYEEARKLYDDAAKYAPGEREKKKLRFNHGDARYMQGDFEGAADEFREALKSDDKEVQKKALFNMGNAYLKKGDVGKAVSAYMNALAVDPHYLPAKKNIEYILRKNESPKDKSDQQNKEREDQKKNDREKNNEHKNDGKKSERAAQATMNPEQLQNLLEMMKQSPVRRQRGKSAGVRVHEKIW